MSFKTSPMYLQLAKLKSHSSIKRQVNWNITSSVKLLEASAVQVSTDSIKSKSEFWEKQAIWPFHFPLLIFLQCTGQIMNYSRCVVMQGLPDTVLFIFYCSGILGSLQTSFFFPSQVSLQSSPTYSLPLCQKVTQSINSLTRVCLRVGRRCSY